LQTTLREKYIRDVNKTEKSNNQKNLELMQPQTQLNL